MKQKKMKCLVGGMLLAALAVGETKVEPLSRTITSTNTNCQVHSTGGVSPLYQVLKGEEVLYSPKANHVHSALISPSGKYVALSSIGKELLGGYGLVVVNCQTGKLKNYQKGKETQLQRWEGEESLVLGFPDLSVEFEGVNALP